MKNQDPIIDEIRRVRHEISEKNGHDAKKLVDHYIMAQKKHAERLIYKRVNKASTELAPVKL